MVYENYKTQLMFEEKFIHKNVYIILPVNFMTFIGLEQVSKFL